MSTETGQDEQAQPERRLLDEDMGYHLHAIRGMEAAQAVMESWMRFVAGKYRLSEGLVVMPDGRIVARPAGTPDETGGGRP